MAILIKDVEKKVELYVESEPHKIVATIDTYYQGLAVLEFRARSIERASFVRKLVIYDTVEQVNKLLKEWRERDYHGEWSIIYNQPPQHE